MCIHTLADFASSICSFRAVIGSTGGGGGEDLVGISSTMVNPPEAVLPLAAFFLAAAALRFWFFLADFVFGFASDY